MNEVNLKRKQHAIFSRPLMRQVRMEGGAYWPADRRRHAHHVVRKSKVKVHRLVRVAKESGIRADNRMAKQTTSLQQFLASIVPLTLSWMMYSVLIITWCELRPIGELYNSMLL